jgi:hypothetical protein
MGEIRRTEVSAMQRFARSGIGPRYRGVRVYLWARAFVAQLLTSRTPNQALEALKVSARQRLLSSGSWRSSRVPGVGHQATPNKARGGRAFAGNLRESKGTSCVFFSSSSSSHICKRHPLLFFLLLASDRL